MSDLTEKKVLILHHADCADGFSAAWVAHKTLGDSATYIASKHGTNPPPEAAGKIVYLLDYSYGEENMKKLVAMAEKVILIDHHATAAAYPSLVAESRFDTNHSGAVLAWEYFNPGKPVPTLLQYVEEGDIWRFTLPNIKELGEAIGMTEQTFEKWDALAANFENETSRAKLAERGAVSLERTQQMIDKAVGEAEEIEFEGHRCLMVNSMFCVSQIGHALYTKMPPIALVWSRRKNKIIVSLRSNGTVDVAQLAQKYGAGGGHPVAASFSWEEANFLKLRVRN